MGGAMIDPTISPLDVPAADKARMWAEDRLVLLKAATERRLIERATQNAGGGLEIGEPQARRGEPLPRVLEVAPRCRRSGAPGPAARRCDVG
jgi:hypothetical protein